MTLVKFNGEWTSIEVVKLELAKRDRPSVKWFLAKAKEHGLTAAYKYTDVQSGGVHYSMCEPERYEREQYWITEQSLDSIDQWHLQNLADDFAIYS